MSDPTAAGETFGPPPRWSRPWGWDWRAALARAWTALRAGGGLMDRIEAEQDRWYLWLPVLVGAGSGMYFSLPAEPSGLFAAAGLLVAVGLFAVSARHLSARVGAGVLLCVAIGFAAAQLRAWWVEEPVLARETGTLKVTGWIEDVEPRGQTGWRVVVRVADIERMAPAERPYRVRLRVPGAAGSLRIGMPVMAHARLLPPPLPALPGDYDFARRAFFQRLGAVGYSRATFQPAPDLGSPPLTIQIWAPVENLRRRVAERIGAVLDGDRAAIAVALIQGDQGGISEGAMQTMRDSGLAHILSISGLHMAIVAGALFWSFRALLALSPWLAQTQPVRTWAAMLALAGATFYLLLSGCQVPAVRSWIMIAIMFAAIALGRAALSLRNVATAALVLLLGRPENLLDVSFLMSFAATTGLVALYEHLAHRRRFDDEAPEPAGPLRRFGRIIMADVATTFVAGLAVAPLAAYFFHNYQHYSVLGNLLALPICTFCLMPLVLIVLITMPLGLDVLPLWGMGWGIEALLAVGTFVASLPGAVSAIPAMPLSAVVAMMLGALWVGLWRTTWRWLGLLVIAAGLLTTTRRERPDLLVGRDAQALAIRLADGRLSAWTQGQAGERGGSPRQGRPQGSYEVTRWLEHDGEARAAMPGLARGKGFRCDQLGCAGEVAGYSLALVGHPAALAEECGRTDILIVRFPRPRPCPTARLVIDLEALRAKGTHWVRLPPTGPQVVTMADWRGQRPWTRDGRATPRRLATGQPLERALPRFAGEDDAPTAEPAPRDAGSP